MTFSATEEQDEVFLNQNEVDNLLQELFSESSSNELELSMANPDKDTPSTPIITRARSSSFGGVSRGSSKSKMGVKLRAINKAYV